MALTFQGATGATNFATSVTLPTHAVGDLIIVFADNMATGVGSKQPAIPSAGGTVPTWTGITMTIWTARMNVAWTTATATNHTSGTWTNAKTMMAVVLRGHKTTGPIGGYIDDSNVNTTNSQTTSSFTMNDTGGSSAIVHFFSVRNSIGTFGWSGTPTGYTSKLSVNSTSSGVPGYRVLTKDSTTSDGSVTQSTTLNCNGRWLFSLEILAAPASGFFAMF